MSRGRVVLAMSGGVDSSVAAQLLVQQGYDVVGVFMRTGAMHEEESCSTGAGGKAARTRGCCSALDAGDAQRVADRLDIPFYALDFAAEFDRIKDYFADEYLAARTPNPCVVCNTWLKFGKLWDYAQAVGADWIATGHYAQAVREDGRTSLRRGVDRAKDQSYFLFGLRYEILERVLFPIGHMEKPAVRAIAAEHDLGVHQKPDSQEVCFIPDGDHRRFVHQHRPDAEQGGDIVEVGGRVVGSHDGISKYTIGQRKGLGVALGSPRFVVGLDNVNRQVVIGTEELLRKDRLTADRVNWLTAEPPTAPIKCRVKIRYQHEPTPAVVEPQEDGRVLVRFASPQTAVTPGQATVFYDDDRVLGGGWIC